MATNPEKEELQERRLDARMEYGHLVTVYVAAANMMWVGFGAFFTINTLLITGLGFSYTEIAKAFSPSVLFFLHVAIPLTGACISVSAIYAANLISDAHDRIRERAIEIEKVLDAKLFAHATRSPSRPYATNIGSLCFFVMWGLILYAVLTN
jgi:hypothetical protein